MTDRVNAAVDPKLSGEQAVKARNAAFAAIGRESQEKTGLQSEVITLYGGAKITSIATSGIRKCESSLRPKRPSLFLAAIPITSNTRATTWISPSSASTKAESLPTSRHFLKLSPQGVADQELVFVSGHPGRTDRLLPVAVLKLNSRFNAPASDWIAGATGACPS